MIFPFLAAFRMARIIYRLIDFYIRTGTLPYYMVTIRFVWKIFTQTYMWFKWWVTLHFLWTSWILGRLLYPLYENLIMYVENQTISKINRRSMRIKRDHKFKILTLPGSLCVFTEIHSIYAQDLPMLSRPHLKYVNSIPYKLITHWNEKRSQIGMFPPDGWPLKLAMAMIAIITIIATVLQGYRTILSKSKESNPVIKSKVFQSQNKNFSAKLRSEVFDGDSDTIIVDNSANCVIWRHKHNFIPESYVKVDPKKTCGVSSAVGSGSPVGIGDLRIGWNDDDGKHHKFVLHQVFHIPDSPVNILGLSSFSKAIGDYQEKGTRINSSGQESIFSWDNGKFKKSFTHSESDMPEMTVNDGYAAFHRFCNFLDRISPISQQYYHTHSPHTSKSIGTLYECGEEILYKNAEHVEKGIIEAINKDDVNNNVLYEIKFRDDRKVTAFQDNIKAPDETDLSVVPNDANDFLQSSKCLTKEELNLIQHPHPLIPLQKEWKTVHDQYGHLLFAKMDLLVQNNMLPKKFAKLKGQRILCPSCIFGKMRKRAWRNKSVSSVKTIRKEKENFPGAKVSIDQLVVAQPGLVPRISGRHTNTRVCGATGFFDNSSGYSFSSLQTSLDGDQTLSAKHSFESHAASCGVKIKKYRADNGRFAEKSFRDDVKRAQQHIDFCAVGAHHQNGIIERHFQKTYLASQNNFITCQKALACYDICYLMAFCL